jgi:hypothetical protein
MKLHLLTTIENRADYMNMCRLWAFSIRHAGGVFADAPISIACNETLDENFAREMRERYGASVHCTPRISKVMRYANKYNALSLPGIEESDWVMFCDSDTIIASDLSPLTSILSDDRKSVWGVSEFPCERVFGLDRLFTRFAGVAPSELSKHHHPWNPLTLPYFNGGVWLVRTQHLPAFRQRVLDLTFELFDAMRASSLNPIHWARVQWNRRVYKTSRAEALVLKPFYPKFYSDQMAIALAGASLGIGVGNLPRAFNWMSDSPGQGENYPIRVLHYVGYFYQLDRANLLRGDWADEYERSGHPGKLALASAYRAYAQAMARR